SARARPWPSRTCRSGRAACGAGSPGATPPEGPRRRRRAGSARRSSEQLRRRVLAGDRHLERERRAASGRRRERDLAAVLLDDAVRDREREARPGPDLFRREERVEDTLGDLCGDPRAGIREDDADPVGFERRDDPDLLALPRDLVEGVARVREQVDEDLL